MNQAKKRADSGPRLSRIILAVSWLITFILFGIAVNQGVGEPILMQRLREATTIEESPQVKFYQRSHGINQKHGSETSMTKPSARGTWLWWKLTLLSAIVSVLFVPIALYSEIKTLRAWLQEWLERRPKRIKLQTEARTATNQPSVTQTVGGTFWSRLRRRVAEHLPGDLAAELINDIVKWIFRSLARR